jgi:hypothetical protein
MQLQANVALLISAIVVAIGLFLALSESGTDASTFGWFLVVVGAVFGAANVLLRTRM